MADSDPLLLDAILAMDAYNEGYAPNLLLNGVSQIGTAVVKRSTLRTDLDAFNAGFAATWYVIDSDENVLSFRGTDSIAGSQDAGGSDFLRGWLVGAGFLGGGYSINTQAGQALAFYQSVVGASPFDSAPAGTLLLGHSLGGGLAGLLSSLTGAQAVGFDYMPFGLAAYLEEISKQVSDHGVFSVAGFKAPNWSNFQGVDTDGEILQYVRSGQVQATLAAPLLLIPYLGLIGVGGASIAASTAILDSSVSKQTLSVFNASTAYQNAIQLHSSALQVFLIYALDNQYEDWQSISGLLLPTMLTDTKVGDALGLVQGTESGASGSADTASQLMELLAYSAVDIGISPFGTTGMDSFFKELNRLGALLEPGPSGSTTVTGPSALVSAEKPLIEMALEYSGDLAKQKISDTSLDDKLFRVSSDDSTFTVDLSKQTWTIGGSQVSNIVGKDTLIDNVLQQAGDGTTVRLAADRLWSDPKLATVDHIVFAATDDSSTYDAQPQSASTSITAYIAGKGNEIVTGSSGNDLLVGGDGDDNISGQDGNNLLIGGAGNDTITGGSGKDVILGGAGNDTVTAGTGQEWIYGGDGDDQISSASSGGGALQIDGGAGSDTIKIDYANAPSSVVAQGGDGADTFQITNADKASFTVLWGGNGADTFDLTSSASNKAIDVAVVRIDNLTETAFDNLDISKLKQYLDTTLGADPNRIVIVNPEATDQLKINGTAVGDVNAFQLDEMYEGVNGGSSFNAPGQNNPVPDATLLTNPTNGTPSLEQYTPDPGYEGLTSNVPTVWTTDSVISKYYLPTDGHFYFTVDPYGSYSNDPNAGALTLSVKTGFTLTKGYRDNSTVTQAIGQVDPSLLTDPTSTTGDGYLTSDMVGDYYNGGSTAEGKVGGRVTGQSMLIGEDQQINMNSVLNISGFAVGDFGLAMQYSTSAEKGSIVSQSYKVTSWQAWEIDYFSQAEARVTGLAPDMAGAQKIGGPTTSYATNETLSVADTLAELRTFPDTSPDDGRSTNGRLSANASDSVVSDPTTPSLDIADYQLNGSGAVGGTSSNDIIYDTNSGDTINAGQGDDQIDHWSGETAETYDYALGDGNDTIDAITPSGSTDTLKLTDMNEADVSLARTIDGSLLVTTEANGQTITIKNQWSAPAGTGGVGTITFLDGTSLDLSQITQDATFEGTEGSDSITIGEANVTVDAATGDDFIQASSSAINLTMQYASGDGSDDIDVAGSGATSNLELTDLNASDVILTRFGNELLITTKATSQTVTVENQFDGTGQTGLGQISFSDGTSLTRSAIEAATTVLGTAGADALEVTQSGIAVDGWGGDDTITNDGLSSGLDIIYRSGDGNDTVSLTTDKTTSSILDLVNLSEADVSVRRFGDDLTVTDLTSDQTINVEGQFSDATGDHGIAVILFSDGMYVTPGDLAQQTTLFGTSGDDVVDVTESNVVIDLGQGNDQVSNDAGVGGLTFEYLSGDGTDQVNFIASSASTSEIELADLGRSDVTLVRIGTDLIISDNSTGQYIDVWNQWYDTTDQNGVGSIVFSNGSVMSREAITEAATIVGTPGNDSIYDPSSNTTVDLGQGDDVVTHNGGETNQTYLYASGDGNDSINVFTPTGSTDKLKFIDLNAADVELTRTEDNRLLIKTLFNGQTIEIENQWADDTGDYGLSSIQFADGTVLNQTQISMNSWIRGTDGDDNIYANGSGTTVDAGLGDDFITHGNGETGQTYVYARGDGNDTINAQTPGGSSDVLKLLDLNVSDVVLTKSQSKDLLIETLSNGQTIDVWNQYADDSGENGISAVQFADGTVWNAAKIGSESEIVGTSGDDDLSVFGQGTTVDGGLGDDTLSSDDGSTGHTFLYRSGDGSDTIHVHSPTGSTDTLKLIDLDPDQVEFTQTEGHDLLIETVATGQTIDVENQWYDDTGDDGINRISFANGQVFDREYITEAAWFRGTDGDDDYYIVGSNTTADLGLGDDKITHNSGETHQTYLYAAGDGNDTINVSTSGGSSDVLKLTDLNQDDVTLTHGLDQDLLVTTKSNGQTIDIQSQWYDNSRQIGISEIQFADGTALDWDGITEAAVLQGTADADQVTVAQSNVTIDLGQGDDQIDNDTGVDGLTYRYARGDGNDQINFVAPSASSNMLELTNLNQADVTLTRTNQDLMIKDNATGEAIDVWNQWYDTTDENGVSAIHFADGTSMGREAITEAGTIVGTDGDDSIYDPSSNTTVDLGLGNDNIAHNSGETGQRYLYARGDGNDTIDVFTPTGSTDRLKFTDLNVADVQLTRTEDNRLLITTLSNGQTIEVRNQWGDDTGDYGLGSIQFADGTVWDQSTISANAWIRGTDGNDNIYVNGSGTTVDAGLGDDFITHGDGEAGQTYRYAQGDGNDTISVTTPGGSSDTLKLTDLDAADVQLARNANGDLQITVISDGQTIDVVGEFSDATGADGIANLAFADGAVLLRQDLVDATSQIITTDTSTSDSGPIVYDLGAGDHAAVTLFHDDPATIKWDSADGNQSFTIESGNNTNDATAVLTNLNRADVALTRASDGALVIENIATGKTLQFANEFVNDWQGIGTLVFADGTMLSGEAAIQAACSSPLPSGAVPVSGGTPDTPFLADVGAPYTPPPGSDTSFGDIFGSNVGPYNQIDGSSHTITFVPGQDANLIIDLNNFGSSHGPNVINYVAADGNVWVRDTAGESDVLQLKDLKSTDVLIQSANNRDGSAANGTLDSGVGTDLIITVKATGKQITFDSYFNAEQFGPGQIIFSDGVSLNHDQAIALLHGTPIAPAEIRFDNAFSYRNLSTQFGEALNTNIIFDTRGETIEVSSGQNTFEFAKADGDAKIIDHQAKTDVLKLTDLNQSDVTFSMAPGANTDGHVSNDLQITVKATGKIIDVVDQFTSGTTLGIGSVQFADGTSMTTADIAAAAALNPPTSSLGSPGTTFPQDNGNPNIAPVTGDDVLQNVNGGYPMPGATGGQNTYTFVAGTDTFLHTSSNGSGDIYKYAAADGNIGIRAENGNDTLEFIDIASTDVIFSKVDPIYEGPVDPSSQYSIEMTILSTGKTITIDFGSRTPIGSYTFADGVTYTAAQVSSMLAGQSSGSAVYRFDGAFTSDTLNSQYGVAATSDVYFDKNNDTVGTNSGITTYHYAAADGYAEINDFSGQGVLDLTDLKSTDVTLSRAATAFQGLNGTDLQITVNSTGRIINVLGQFGGDGTAGITQINFADNVSLTGSQIADAATTTTPSLFLESTSNPNGEIYAAGNDLDIVTTAGSNVVNRIDDGAAHNVTLDVFAGVGGNASNIYLNGPGSISGVETIRLHGMMAADVIFAPRGGEDYLIYDTKTGDLINIGHGQNTSYPFSNVVFADDPASTPLSQAQVIASEAVLVAQNTTVGFTAQAPGATVYTAPGGGEIDLNGSAGTTIKYWSWTGNLRVSDSASTSAPGDTVDLVDLKSTDVTITDNGANKIVTVNATGNTITIENQNAAHGSGVTTLAFADGVTTDVTSPAVFIETQAISTANAGAIIYDLPTGQNFGQVTLDHDGPATILWHAASGNQTFYIGTPNPNNAIAVLDDLASTDVTVSRNGGDLIVTNNSTGATLTFTDGDYPGNDFYGVNEIDFSDHVVFTRAQIDALVDSGRNEVDNISGWTVDLGAGDHNFTKALGHDDPSIVIWDANDGNETFDVESNHYVNDATLKISGLTPNQVSINNSGPNLVLTNTTTGKTITFLGADTYAWEGVATVQFDDGTVWTGAELRPTAIVELTNDNQTFVTNDGTNTAVTDGTGNNIIQFGDQYDVGTLNSVTYSKADGTLDIESHTSAPSANTLNLTDLDASDITLARQNNDLLITVTSTGNIIKIGNQFAASDGSQGLVAINFEDGTSYHFSDFETAPVAPGDSSNTPNATYNLGAGDHPTTLNLYDDDNSTIIWSGGNGTTVTGDGNEGFNITSDDGVVSDNLVIHGLTTSQVSFERNSSDLIVLDKLNDKSVTFTNQFARSSTGINTVTFDDGTVLSRAEIMSGYLVVSTAEIDNTPNLIWDQGTGDGSTTVTHNDANAEIIWGKDDGSERFQIDTDGNGNSTTTLVLSGLNEADVALNRSGNALTITNIATGATFEMTDQFNNDGTGVASIVFDDGTLATKAAISLAAVIPDAEEIDNSYPVTYDQGQNGGAFTKIYQSDNSVVVWAAGDSNQDFNIENRNTGDAILQLKGLNKSDIAIQRRGNDLYIVDVQTSKAIRFEHQIDGDNYGIGTIQFQDGTSITGKAAINALAVIVDETSTRGQANVTYDILPTMDGSAHNEVTAQYETNTTVEWGAGASSETFHLEQNGVDADGTINLLTLKMSDVTLTQSANGRDLIITNIASGSTLTMENQFSDFEWGVAKIVFADRTISGKTVIANYAAGILNTTEYDNQTGITVDQATPAGQTDTVILQNDTATIAQWAKSDGSEIFKITGSNTADTTLQLTDMNASDVYIERTSYNDLLVVNRTTGATFSVPNHFVNGTDGLGTIKFADGTSISGHDAISSQALITTSLEIDNSAPVTYDEGLSGSQDQTFTKVYRSDNSTIVWSKADGAQDFWLENVNTGDGILKLTDLNASDVQIERRGADLYVRDLATGKEIRFEHQFSDDNFGIGKIQFADGTSIVGKDQIRLDGVIVDETNTSHEANLVYDLLPTSDRSPHGEVSAQWEANTTVEWGAGASSETFHLEQTGDADSVIDLMTLKSTDVTLTKSTNGQDLVITNITSGNTLTIEQQLNSASWGAAKILFSDTEIDGKIAIAAAADSGGGPGVAASPSEYANTSNLALDLGAGRHTGVALLNDSQATVIWDASDGNESFDVENTSGTSDATLELTNFAIDTNPIQMGAERVGNDLIFINRFTGATLTILNQYSGSQYGFQYLAEDGFATETMAEFSSDSGFTYNPGYVSYDSNDQAYKSYDLGPGDHATVTAYHDDPLSVFWGAEDGNEDFVIESNNSTNDAVMNVVGLTSDQVTLKREGNDLAVFNNVSGKFILIENEYNQLWQGVASINFVDTSIDHLALEEIAPSTIVSTPSSSSDLSSVTYDLGTQDQRPVSLFHDDPATIVWEANDGNQTFTIESNSYSNDATLRIVGLQPIDVSLSRSGSDAVITNLATGKTMTLTDGADAGADYKGVANIVFDDGTTIPHSELEALPEIQPISTNDLSSITYDLGAGNQPNVSLAHDDPATIRWHAASGNQSFDIESNHFTDDAKAVLDDLTSTDVTITRNGNDLIVTNIQTQATLTFTGGANASVDWHGVNEIDFSDGVVFSRAQIDALVDTGTNEVDNSSNVVVDLGAGNHADTTLGHDDPSTIIWSATDGNEQFAVENNGYRNDATLLIHGLTPNQVTVDTSGPDLVLTNMVTGAHLTFYGADQHGWQGVSQVVFDDGTVWTHAHIQPSATVTLTDDGQTFTTTDGTNTTVADGKGDNQINLGDSLDVETTNSVVYAKADGNLDIESHVNAPSANTLVLADLDASEVSLVRQNNDLIVTVDGTGNTIKIGGEFNSDDGTDGISNITFADGDALDRAGIESAALVLGTSGDDSMTPASDGVTVDPGLGNDYVNLRGNGSDTVLFAAGDGNDTLDNTGGGYARHDTLKLVGISASDVTMETVGQGVSINDAVTGDSIRINSQFYNDGNAYGVDDLEFGDGTVWDRDQIAAAADYTGVSIVNHPDFSGPQFAGASTDHQTNQSGWSDDHTYLYNFGDGDATIDTYTPTGSSDTLKLTDLNPSDVALTHAANGDLLVETPSNGQTIDVANQFADTDHGIGDMSFADGTLWGTTQISEAAWYRAGSGDTTVTAGAGNATLVAGAGNDTLAGGAGNDTFVYGSSNGNLTIHDNAASSDPARFNTLSFVDLDANDMTFHQTGNDLLIDVSSTGKSISVTGEFTSLDHDGIQQINFADGSNWTRSQIQNHAGV